MTDDTPTGPTHVTPVETGTIVVTQEEADKVALVLRQRHGRRWRALSIWIAVFTIVVFWALNSLRYTTASLHQLQKTNCGLKTFLLSAKAVRLDSASQQTDGDRDTNLQAARGYQKLADTITAVGHCKIAKRYLVKVPSR